MCFFRVQALLLSICQGLILVGFTVPIHRISDSAVVAVLASFQTALMLFCTATVAHGMFIHDLRTFGRWVGAFAWGCAGSVVAFGLSQLVLAALGMRGTATVSLIAIGAMSISLVMAAYNTCTSFEQFRLRGRTKNPLEARGRVHRNWVAILFLFAAPLCMNTGALGIKALGDKLFHPVAILVAIVVIWGFATELDEKYNEMVA